MILSQVMKLVKVFVGANVDGISEGYCMLRCNSIKIFENVAVTRVEEAI